MGKALTMRYTQPNRLRNRQQTWVAQIGMDNPGWRRRTANLGLHAILPLVLTLLAVSSYAAPVNLVDLGTAANFGLLAGSTITNTGSSVINGDVGVSPGTAVTGFGPVVVNGTTHLADAKAVQAQTDLTAAYITAAGAVYNTDLSTQDLGGKTLTPGVYYFSSSAGLTGNLTLNGGGDPNAQWIFRIGSTLTTASGSNVALTNGATQGKVFWQVGSSATIGVNNNFAGNIMALQSITLNGGGILNGRALARNGAVTISSVETVNAVPEPSSIMALGMMLIPTAALFRRKK
jgi:hypothetical protein